MITITTGGYGDLGISEAGQQFTSVLLVGGIGVASYGVATIVEGVMSLELGRERWMRQKMDAMADHTIVCGFGEMGRSVVRELDPSRVIVVTRDEDDLEAAREAGLLAVDGSPTEDESRGPPVWSGPDTSSPPKKTPATTWWSPSPPAS